MKKNKMSILCLSALLAVSSLVGCGGKTSSGTTNSGTSSSKTSETKSEYTVSFYVDSVLYGEKQIVKEGEKVTKPADPERTADEEYTYTFNGWYENGVSTAWNFEQDVVTKNLDLFAEFDEVPISYDLIVWVYGVNGATTPTTYITFDESERMKEVFSSTLEGKTISWQYFEGLTNAAFNAKVQSKKVKPDIVVSGAKVDNADDNGLSFKENYGKKKVGTGWFTNTSRYTGILESCDANIDLAVDLYEMITANGPDYFEMNASSITLKVGETKELAATLNAGDNRTPTYSIGNSEVASLENGVVKGVSEGTTTLTATLGLVSIDIEVTIIPNVDYDLVVWVYGINGATTPTTYITFDESEYLRSEFMSLEIAKDKDIFWHYSEGLVNADFNAAVNEANPVVDVVISGNKLDNDTTSIPCHETYGKVRMGDGWFEDTGRRVAVTANCNDHIDLAVALYDLARNVGPNHELSMSDTEVALTVGDTYQLEAFVYKKTVTWSSSDESIATVENGLVTAVAAGTATITAKDSDNNEVTCVVTVSAKENIENEEKYDLVVWIYGVATSSTYITVEESEILRNEFLELDLTQDKEISWIYSEGLKNAEFNEAVNNADPYVDVVISGNKLDNDTTSIATHETYGKVDAGEGWFENTSRKVAITANCNDHIDLAVALYDLVSNPKATEDTGNDEIEEVYDLVVYVHMSANTVYLTSDELTAIKDAFTAEGAAGYGKKILWVEVSGVKNAPFGEKVLASEGNGACDVVIGTSGITSGGSVGITLNEDGRQKIDGSWYAYENNYIGVLDTANSEHLALANDLVSMLTSPKA